MIRLSRSLMLSAAGLCALLAARAPAAAGDAGSTQYAIDNFLAQRAELITANAPDLTGRLDRNGAFGAGDLSGLAASGGPTQFTVDFSTSLGRLAKTFRRDPPPAKDPSQKLEAYGPLDSRLRVPAGTAAEPVPLDVWSGSRWTHDGGTDFGSTGMGADYRVDPGLLVGLAAQFDWTTIDDPGVGTAAEGAGWMVGPYIERQLRPNLVFDGRAGWGLSDNRIGLAGADAAYGTTRWFAHAVLKGDCADGPWHFSPQVAALYFEGGQGIGDGAARALATQGVAIGRVTFGPSMSYAVHTGWATIKPSILVNGIWDFDQAATVDVDSGLVTSAPADIHARAEVQMPFSFANGTSLTAKGYLDGIGDAGFHPYGASMQLTIPLG